MTARRLLTMATVLIACFSAILALGVQKSAAQEGAATYPLMINVQQCEDPAGCEGGDTVLLGDITVNATSEDGSVDYGSCVTSIEGKPSGCTIDVEPETTVAVTVDAASIPDGYVELEYPVLYDVPAEVTQVGDVWITLVPQQDTVPDDQDTDEEAAADEDTGDTGATQLPSTGAGMSAESSNAGVMAFGLFGLMSLILAGGAVAFRRRGSASQRS
jgi:hypothetical protein